MEQRNEPTTAELVKELYRRADCKPLIDAWDEVNRVCNLAGNCIERLERELAEANARADAAIADVRTFARNAHTCRHNGECTSLAEMHDSCDECPMWDWRGAHERSKETK